MLRVFLSRVLDVLLHRRREGRLSQEVEAHLDLLTEEYVARGLSREDAQYAAQRAFGGVERIKTIHREQRALPLFDNLFQDIRFAIRLLAKERRFTLTAVLALALGIGANTAIFSLVDSLVLRPLPVKDPVQLAIVADSHDTSRKARSYAVWQALWSRRAIFDGVLAWSHARFNLVHGGETELADGLCASASTFETLGVRALLGRMFTQHDDVRGGGPDGPVAVISHGFWQRHFGGASNAVGQTLMLGGVPFTVVGVTPPTFFGLEVGRPFDIAIPLGAEPLLMGAETALDSRSTRWLTLMVRLRPDQSLDEAVTALRGVQPQIREESLPEDFGAADRATYLTAPLTLVPSSTGASPLRERYQRPLLTILALVAIVLLIACANVANLLLARAAARRHEWSVRLAMGASRWRLARQLIVESVLLSSAAALLGAAMAPWASRVLVNELSTRTNRVFLDLTPDGRVLLFTIAVTAITALLFGTVPALRAAGTAPIDALKAHGRTIVGRGRLSMAHGLVVVQVALCVVLLVGAGLFIRTFTALANRDLGFDREPILIVDVSALRTTIGETERLSAYGQLRERVLTVPGVANAAVSLETPLTGGTWDSKVNVSNSAHVPNAQSRAGFNAVSPGWFATFGVPMLAGRDVSDDDQAPTAPVIIVNEAFARRFFNSASPLGQTVAIQYGDTTMPAREIVGLVADAVDAVDASAREQAPPTVYVPLAQFALPSSQVPIGAFVIVRASLGSPALLARGVGAAIADVNRDFALTFLPFIDQVNAALVRERIVAMLATAFGVLALLLAGLGLYGVTSYAVARRRPEIGVRLALGARPSAVVSLVLSRVFSLIGIGVLTGLGLSLWMTQFVATLLFGLEPRDPATFAGAAAILALVGIIAGLVPALRASRIDPVSVLRES
jgi:putative ABC transport system permease protein